MSENHSVTDVIEYRRGRGNLANVGRQMNRVPCISAVTHGISLDQTPLLFGLALLRAKSHEPQLVRRNEAEGPAIWSIVELCGAQMVCI